MRSLVLPILLLMASLGTLVGCAAIDTFKPANDLSDGFETKRSSDFARAPARDTRERPVAGRCVDDGVCDNTAEDCQCADCVDVAQMCNDRMP